MLSHKELLAKYIALKLSGKIKIPKRLEGLISSTSETSGYTFYTYYGGRVTVYKGMCYICTIKHGGTFDKEE